MKKRMVALMLLLCMSVSAVGCQKTADVSNTETEVVQETTEETEVESTEAESADGNMLENGDFSNSTEHWGLFLDQGGNSVLSVEDGVGTLAVKNIGSVNYSNQLYYDGFGLKQGGVYKLSFDMSSTVARPFEVRIQINGGDYHAYMDEVVDLTEDMQSFSYEFTMEDESDVAPRLCFNLGVADGLDNVEHTIKLDNVEIEVLDESNAVAAEDGDKGNDINVNQIGYLPNADKTAVVRNQAAGSAFSVKDADGNVVYEGTLSEEKASQPADETVCIADFSEVKAEGTYTVTCGDVVSYEFAIKEKIYDELLKDTVRLMYLQRCGSELTEEYAGKYAHPVCHNEEATIYGTDEKKEVSGGWHDAGDYGRYVVTGAQTAMDLILCYELNAEFWDSYSLDIPESNNDVADILDEVKYEMDWMLKMQDEKSGGVYHKVSGYNFPGFVMPEEETTELVLAPISTTATADFAAIMARSSDTFETIDPDFSKKALAAAKKAWDYLEKNQSKTGYLNPSEISTGEYPDEKDTDERFWAAVELYRVTGEEKYSKYFEAAMDEEVPLGYGWIEMGSYGALSYLSMESSKQKPEYLERIKNTIIAKADQFVSYAENEGYGCSLALEGYNWGSNLGVCNNARELILANAFTGEDKYLKVAQRQIDYLLGENSLSTSFVTGYGTVCPGDVHHRPSYAKGEAVKGMLVGGPNSGIEDPYAANVLKDMPPAKCYVDNQQSYATNEVTIYWNSPLAALLTYMYK